VLSRTDTDIPTTITSDTYLDYQLGLLLDGHETDYGFIVAPSLDSASPGWTQPGPSHPALLSVTLSTFVPREARVPLPGLSPYL